MLLLFFSGPHILMCWECSLNGTDILSRLDLLLLALALNLIWLCTLSATSLVLAKCELILLFSRFRSIFSPIHLSWAKLHNLLLRTCFYYNIIIL